MDTEPANDRELRLWEARSAKRTELFTAHIGAIAGFAGVTINSIILANGAAAGAVLAFVAPLWGKPEAKLVAGPALHSVGAFVIGVTAAMLCGVASYLAQYCYGRQDLAPDNSRRKRNYNRVGMGFHVVALAAGLAGVAAFAVGAIDGLEALALANGGVGSK